ncbi:MAG: ABC transporter ATP-binding protein [Faecalibacillus sp.]
MKNDIEVKHLKKSFQGRMVINDLSFCVKKGTVFGLLGPNGAGKSTTIDMILGLKKPDEGEALIMGKTAIKHRKEIFEKVGVQLQTSHYQDLIKVKELCQERGALYKNCVDYRQLLKQFNLLQYENNFVKHLSGGEKQKLSVVLSLIHNPDIVFLDELTTGLDVQSRYDVWKTLLQLKEKGLTIFLTTHYMEEAEKMCDEICLIKKGKKVKEGTVKQLIEESPYDNLEKAYLWYLEESYE